MFLLRLWYIDYNRVSLRKEAASWSRRIAYLTVGIVTVTSCRNIVVIGTVTVAATVLVERMVEVVKPVRVTVAVGFLRKEAQWLVTLASFLTSLMMPVTMAQIRAE